MEHLLEESPRLTYNWPSNPK